MVPASKADCLFDVNEVFFGCGTRTTEKERAEAK
jgi:hypothetical protein